MESFARLAGGGCTTNDKSSSLLELPLPAAASSPASELIPPDSQHHSLPPPLYQLFAGPAPSARHGHHHSGGAAAVQGQISPAEDAEAVKAEIMSHPQYSSLLAAYLGCKKVGAPPDALARLSAVPAKLDATDGHPHRRRREPRRDDPELDQFMDAYCNMLARYREELERPIQEAAEFFRSVEMELGSIADSNCEGTGSSEEEQDTSCPDEEIKPCDNELKQQLLRKYAGSLGGLRQEFSKRTKKGKLPKEARQKLLHWWELHYKWPYPSETEKMTLAQSTGLDQKQINNWFINQRKRHWKPAPAAGMAFTTVGAGGGGFHHHYSQGGLAAALPLYMGRPFMVNGMYRLGP
ncbi:hypothetical protein E2562_010769 [Oryza meyeriana var. granulata]|uniref:Homeobox domain-containing protein n=1 Tax=Oryza meyeriana var. granulata TaxID=110450 RepID=A0A6G1EWJ1_9ORYZ|nr:hypothetical protein E2562_010769 [Oryza meyeriana var. granulata]